MQKNDFNEGDIFYVHYANQYHIYKLLKKDEAEETFHVLCYETMHEEPRLSHIHQLRVYLYHAPIHHESFHEAVFLTTIAVTDDELIGYHEYLQQTENDFEETIRNATEHYRKAYELTDEGKYEEAIQHYTAAIELVPTFHEAIDNRAFCKMDMGRWREAIEDFQLSLSVDPGSLLAAFSIGECYYRLGEFAKAKDQFEKCVHIDPTHEVSKDFLARSQQLMNKE